MASGPLLGLRLAAQVPRVSAVPFWQTSSANLLRTIHHNRNLKERKLNRMNERPTPPLCHCSEPMKLVRTLPHIEGVPEIFVFYCERCKQAETKVQENAA